MTWQIKIRRDGEMIHKAKFDELDDIQPIIEGLKEKFNGRRQK